MESVTSFSNAGRVRNPHPSPLPEGEGEKNNVLAVVLGRYFLAFALSPTPLSTLPNRRKKLFFANRATGESVDEIVLDRLVLGIRCAGVIQFTGDTEAGASFLQFHTEV